jgi:hypothetical protein
MRPNDAYDRFETEFSYPITREEIVDAIGDTTVQAPRGPSESVAEVLERTETPTFQSPQDLRETFFANLCDQYVGRKFYDDRGRTVVGDETAAI